jgi:hypothetical protein
VRQTIHLRSNADAGRFVFRLIKVEAQADLLDARGRHDSVHLR